MSMKNIQLPKDIVKYVKKKIIGYVALFVLLECAAIVINVLTWEYFAARTPLPFHIGVIVWICIVPFIILKFPFKLIDRSWRGEIVEISVEEERDAYYPGGVKDKVFPYVKHVIYLKVKLGNGKHKRIAVQEFGRRQHIGVEVPNEGDVRNHLDDYLVGDSVYHFYGLKYNYVVKKNSEQLVCVVCGSKNKKDSDECFKCGHSIIKNIDN